MGGGDDGNSSWRGRGLFSGGESEEQTSTRQERKRSREVRLEGDDRGEMEEEEKKREGDGGRKKSKRKRGREKSGASATKFYVPLTARLPVHNFFFFSHWGGGQRRDRGPIPLGIAHQNFFPLALGYPSTPPSLPPSQCSTQAYRVYQLRG